MNLSSTRDYLYYRSEISERLRHFYIVIRFTRENLRTSFLKGKNMRFTRVDLQFDLLVISLRV